MAEKAEVKKINLKDRVLVTLISDLPSMRKFKGDKIKTHPENLPNLVKKGIISSKESKEVLLKKVD